MEPILKRNILERNSGIKMNPRFCIKNKFHRKTQNMAFPGLSGMKKLIIANLFFVTTPRSVITTLRERQMEQSYKFSLILKLTFNEN